jgi:hypothetical protein
MCRLGHNGPEIYGPNNRKTPRCRFAAARHRESGTIPTLPLSLPVPRDSNAELPQVRAHASPRAVRLPPAPNRLCRLRLRSRFRQKLTRLQSQRPDQESRRLSGARPHRAKGAAAEGRAFGDLRARAGLAAQLDSRLGEPGARLAARRHSGAVRDGACQSRLALLGAARRRPTARTRQPARGPRGARRRSRRLAGPLPSAPVDPVAGPGAERDTARPHRRTGLRRRRAGTAGIAEIKNSGITGKSVENRPFKKVPGGTRSLAGQKSFVTRGGSKAARGRNALAAWRAARAFRAAGRARRASAPRKCGAEKSAQKIGRKKGAKMAEFPKKDI